MRAEHRRPFVAFFLVAALCALALGSTTGNDSVPAPSVGTPDRAIVPRAAPAPMGFELLGETAAQLLVKRIRAAAAVDVPASPETPAAATSALAGVDASAADSVAPEPARVRSDKTGSSATRAGDRGASPQPAPQPQLQTIERSPEPSPQPVQATPATTPQPSGGADRSSASGTSGPPAHAGSRGTSSRTTGQSTSRAKAHRTSHTKSHGKARGKSHGKARGKSNGKARGKGPGKAHRKGKGRR